METVFIEKRLFIYNMSTTGGVGGENVAKHRHIKSDYGGPATNRDDPSLSNFATSKIDHKTILS